MAPTLELPGFHAVKHAIRFGAEDLQVWTDDADRVLALAERTAPDVTERLSSLVSEVGTETFEALG
ncbi:MAG: rRNA methyltransferase, partial [Actinomycetota bacterium]